MRYYTFHSASMPCESCFISVAFFSLSPTDLNNKEKPGYRRNSKKRFLFNAGLCYLFQRCISMKTTNRQYDITDCDCGRTMRLALLYRVLPRRLRPETMPEPFQAARMFVWHKLGRAICAVALRFEQQTDVLLLRLSSWKHRGTK